MTDAFDGIGTEASATNAAWISTCPVLSLLAMNIFFIPFTERPTCQIPHKLFSRRRHMHQIDLSW
jgi:hypothetical protein